MRSTPLKLFACAAALTFVGAAFGNSRDDSKQRAVAEVAGYKGWSRVTVRAVPFDLSSLGGG
ncbi:MAG TPA: hypothetical protein VGX48_26515 [Pyrinomonadaceae bacterium]|jgi:hypothetical protein|nr:hypothetical protein [Pyrinomonadaceae bacterium]